MNSKPNKKNTDFESYMELEALGILKTDKLPAELSWMTDNQKHVMMVLLLSGDNGCHKNYFKKILKEEPDCILYLEIKAYVEWINDNRGRPTHLLLTWKGDEVAKLVQHVAKNQSHKTTK